jgi:hypothetical protein
LRARDDALGWSVKNQARMHERNADRPYRSASDAMMHSPETATAVGARLGDRAPSRLPLPSAWTTFSIWSSGQRRVSAPGSIVFISSVSAPRTGRPPGHAWQSRPSQTPRNTAHPAPYWSRSAAAV